MASDKKSPGPDVVERIDIAAPPAVVWSAVSDPSQYGRWSPEATGARRRGKANGPWSLGDRFFGTNRHWVPWATNCRVAAAVPLEEFAFDVDLGPFPLSRWAYELSPLPDGGTRLAERWTDRRVGWMGTLVKPTGLLVGRGMDAAGRNRETMRATLAAIKSDVEAGAS